MVEHLDSSDLFQGNKKDKNKNDKKGKGKSGNLAPKAGLVKQNSRELGYNCEPTRLPVLPMQMPKRGNPPSCKYGVRFTLSERFTNDRSCLWATSSTADIKVKGDVYLKLTSEKEAQVD
ncbi:hypothetical protein Tco_0860720 [Tanacetum coccineum]|uniref:Uncharacterized protein n=1 Tax=Tanacetum coccineum TaxID=301880 RepID=A0ABQ5BIS1_9ASTR